jgi:hypothetical protein
LTIQIKDPQETLFLKFSIGFLTQNSKSIYNKSIKGKNGLEMSEKVAPLSITIRIISTK